MAKELIIWMIATLMMALPAAATITFGPGVTFEHGNSTYTTTYNHSVETTYDSLTIGVHSVLLGNNNVSIVPESGNVTVTMDDYDANINTVTRTGYTGTVGVILNNILIILLAVAALGIAATAIMRYKE